MNKFILMLAVFAGLVAAMYQATAGTYSYEASRDGAAAFFTLAKKTEDSIRKRYQSAGIMSDQTNPLSVKSKVNLLIMPGHEPGYGGAEYKDTFERELNVELAGYMRALFEQNGRFQVVVPRDNEQWSSEFKEYFEENYDAIIKFENEQQKEMAQQLSKGTVKKSENNIVHNAAPTDVAHRLYGINKWANDNDVDMAIHIHFNDYPRKNSQVPGKHTGFAIYVPERQYSNSTTTKAIADAIYKRLSKYYPVSDLPKESVGVIEEQELIAIGSHNTLDAPSMLIEYGYIYEQQFQYDDTREAMLKDLAFATYLGVQDFINQNYAPSLTYDVLSLPYTWKKSFSQKGAPRMDTYALQMALTYLGTYPPVGKTKNDCPISGAFGPCTRDALKAFQRTFNIEQTGAVGPKTLKLLNEQFTKPTM
ncbi:MAG: N-acetylmuramoyl-L-alanine amidase [Patescibacteria group bacterium]